MTTKEEVLRIAAEAGFKRNPFYPQVLTARDMDPIQLMGACEKLIELAKAQGAAEEREACLKICEGFNQLALESRTRLSSAFECAEAIRNRERKE